ncbi:hypothetical protein ZEAMMB73_Zm00001d003135 [Zea mays]|uniref:Uncharacterized protein n=1 Tax=Zea mays TaxID=4577 RepID=A0A1D6E6Y4_MAIZE|nr:hypothetical protein ZEAMMB73_Zm00001d003135 [Zea mays]
MPCLLGVLCLMPCLLSILMSVVCSNACSLRTVFVCFGGGYRREALATGCCTSTANRGHHAGGQKQPTTTVGHRDVYGPSRYTRLLQATKDTLREEGLPCLEYFLTYVILSI